jgi:predicted Zn-dependent protease
MLTRLPGKALTFLLLVLLLAGPLSRPARAELSIEDEKKMGEQFLTAALRQFRFIEDPEVVDYINKVGQRLVKHLEAHTFPYDFYVVDSNALNAFAAPAGHIFINRGLLEFTDNEGELASILAHEIAHVQSRHIAERLARSQKLSLVTLGGLLAGIFLGGSGTAGQAVIAGTLAGSASLQLSYSRQNEEEADRKGLRYTEAAGYPGQEMVSIFQKMSQQSWQEGGKVPTYLETHPGLSERVNYLAATLEARQKSSKRREEFVEDNQGFRMMQAKLLGAYEDPSAAEPQLRSWLAQPDTRVMGLYGMGLLERRQGKMEDAATSLKKAISLRPDLPPLLVELGETYFQMGQVDKAVSVVQSALSLDPNQPAALCALGRFLLERKNTADARDQLSRAAQLNDRFPSVHYYLGLAYGQLNQLGEAHYQFGIHDQGQGSWKSALFHYREALRYTDNPERQKAIREAMKEMEEEVRGMDGEGGSGRRRSF